MRVKVRSVVATGALFGAVATVLLVAEMAVLSVAWSPRAVRAATAREVLFLSAARMVSVAPAACSVGAALGFVGSILSVRVCFRRMLMACLACPLLVLGTAAALRLYVAINGFAGYGFRTALLESIVLSPLGIIPVIVMMLGLERVTRTVPVDGLLDVGATKMFVSATAIVSAMVLIICIWTA